MKGEHLYGIIFIYDLLYSFFCHFDRLIHGESFRLKSAHQFCLDVVPITKRVQGNFSCVCLNKDGPPLIICLLYSGSPFAVFLTVWSVVIQSFYAVFWGWSRTHVFEESRKRREPFIRHFYTSCSVILERFILRVVTSPSHIEIAPVLRTVSHFYREPVLKMHSAHDFLMQASARSSSSIYQ